MIREVWEETGLTVEAPKLGGLYHWHKSGVHYVITLYKADKFTGELKSSEEGRVYWIPLEELKQKNLLQVWNTFCGFWNQRRWTSAICIWKQMDMWETCIKELHEKWLPAHWRKDSHSL